MKLDVWETPTALAELLRYPLQKKDVEVNEKRTTVP